MAYKNINTQDDGITIKVATQEMIALNLIKWASDKSGTNALKAIQMIIDNTDGKMPDTIIINDLKSKTDEELILESEALERELKNLL